MKILQDLIEAVKARVNENRDIDVDRGNYVEYLRGNYIQNIYIDTKSINRQKGCPHNIPRSNTEKFIGRQQELATLHQQLQNEEEVTIAHLEGMGGIGKTELASTHSLLSLKLNTYPGGICWLSARDEDIPSQIVSFARTKLNLPVPKDLEAADKVDWCWTNWQEGTTLLYRSQGRSEEAEPLYLQALELRKKILGDEHPNTINSLNNLAALYYSQGRSEEAETLYLQALALRKKILGDEHPDTINSLNNLAALYYLQGRSEEAEPLFLQALALRKKILGEEHPDTISSLNNLALLYDS